MKAQIHRLDPNQFGAMSAYLHGFLATTAYVITVFVSIFREDISTVGTAVFMPFAVFFYVIWGFIVGAIMAWFYNFASRKVGGIKMELEIKLVPVESTTGDEPKDSERS